MSTATPPLLAGTVSGTVTGIDAVSEDTRIVRISPSSAICHLPGQYMKLTFRAQEERAYSIASAPHNPLLSFHIRGTGHGVSHDIVHHLQIGENVGLRGPFGMGLPLKGTQPVLLLAGGVGIAPVLGILDSLPSEITSYVYWGARNRSALYLHHDLQSRLGNRYIPVLSETGEEGFRTGTLADALAADFASLSGHRVYIAGPKPMIDATTPLLLEKGVEKGSIFGDAFTL